MPTLEEALISQGLVTRQHVEEARRLQREISGTLGLNLIRLKYVAEEDIVEACRRAVPGLPVADQQALAKASSFALGLVPLSLIERFRAVPLVLQGSKLLLAMADPLDADAISTIERYTKCRVVPMVAAESVLSWALLRYFNLLTPTYAAAVVSAPTAATAPVPEGEDDGYAIPLLRRRRGPVGDAPDDLDQVPVDLPVQRRKSAAPAPPEPDLSKLQEALARMERQQKRTVPITPEIAAGPVAPPPAPPSARQTPPPGPAFPVSERPAEARAQAPSSGRVARPISLVKTLPPPAPPAAEAAALQAARAASAERAPATTKPLEPIRRAPAPAAATAPVGAPGAPEPHAVARAMPPPETEAAAGAAPRHPLSATRPLPLVPKPQASSAAAPSPAEAFRVAAQVPARHAAELPGAPVAPGPGPDVPTRPPAGAEPAARRTTPHMGIAAPFSPSLPGLPGLMPITDQAVARLRERIASVEDRDAVTASALWTVEEVLGPAGFVSRRGEDLVVHRAGKHFRAVFGPGDLVLPGGKETRVEQAFLSGEPEVVPAEGFPLAAVGHRSIPPRLVMIPVSIRGKVAGVVIAFTEKATEVAMAEISRYRQIADVVSERLLVFLVKKKARQSLPP